jgi:RHS repeat-associated protein
MRSQGNGNYTLILTFDRTVLAATSTSIASGVAAVNGVPIFSGSTATVQLSGVADRQTVVIELDNVTGVSGITGKVFVAVSFLKGDVNQDGAVTPEDVFLVRSSTGTNPTASTFPRDVNANGIIDSGDVFVDRQAYGDSLFPDFAFTGHYYHARSGLYLAPYRAYNPTIGRWLSRDPIGERGGLNLNGYVKNDPINSIDPVGLEALFHFSNGRTAIANNTSDFVGIVRNARSGTISSIDIWGHANSVFQSFDTQNPAKTSGIIAARSDAWLIDGGAVVMRVGSLLEGKFDLGNHPRINLNGCQTALGDANIAKMLSVATPNVLITGSPDNTTDPGPGLINWGNQMLDRIFNTVTTYLNGKRQ